MSLRSVNDLNIYTKSLHLTIEIFNLAKNPTLNREWSLCDQIKRAATSIPANISEGFGRQTKKDFAQFLSIALGSCNEVVTFLDIIDINFKHVSIEHIKIEYTQLSKSIYSFRKITLSQN